MLQGNAVATPNPSVKEAKGLVSKTSTRGDVPPGAASEAMLERAAIPNSLAKADLRPRALSEAQQEFGVEPGDGGAIPIAVFSQSTMVASRVLSETKERGV